MMSEDKRESKEPIFVNQCIYTKDVWLEMYRKTQPVWLKGLIILITLLTAVCFCIDLKKETYGKAIDSLLLLIFVWFVYKGLPRFRINGTIKQIKTLYHALSQVTVSFYEDDFSFLNETSGAKATADYTQIIKILQSRNLYFLKLQPQLYVLVDKNGFQKGTLAEFEQFIRKKASKRTENL